MCILHIYIYYISVYLELLESAPSYEQAMVLLCRHLSHDSFEVGAKSMVALRGTCSVKKGYPGGKGLRRCL